MVRNEWSLLFVIFWWPESLHLTISSVATLPSVKTLRLHGKWCTWWFHGFFSAGIGRIWVYRGQHIITFGHRFNFPMTNQTRFLNRSITALQRESVNNSSEPATTSSTRNSSPVSGDTNLPFSGHLNSKKIWFLLVT